MKAKTKIKPKQTPKSGAKSSRCMSKSPTQNIKLPFQQKSQKMAAVSTSISKALPGLTQSLESALPSLPTEEKIKPAKNGITLLDAKNEIFLSYLQTLALRNLAVIRSVGKHVKNKSASTNGDASSALDQDLDDQLVKDLVKHRVYLEKGVRPLEDRLKYQIDKVVRAAEDEARAQEAASAPASTKKTSSKKAAAPTASDSEEDDDDEEDEESEVDELSFRPSAASFTRAPAAPGSAPSTTPEVSAREKAMAEDGIYRPPRITATAMPTTERKEAKDKRPMRSATIDEYVTNELSEAPYAQPSIGSTIVNGGRRDKSARERREEEERREYEESNLVRLPKESKKDKAKKAHRERGAFGGEDWRGLTDGVDRIDRLTKKKTGGGALERSRKRKADEDGQRGDGAGGVDMGRDFERRKKRTMRK